MEVEVHVEKRRWWWWWVKKRARARPAPCATSNASRGELCCCLVSFTRTCWGAAGAAIISCPGSLCRCGVLLWRTVYHVVTQTSRLHNTIGLNLDASPFYPQCTSNVALVEPPNNCEFLFLEMTIMQSHLPSLAFALRSTLWRLIIHGGG